MQVFNITVLISFTLIATSIATEERPDYGPSEQEYIEQEFIQPEYKREPTGGQNDIEEFCEGFQRGIPALEIWSIIRQHTLGYRVEEDELSTREKCTNRQTGEVMFLLPQFDSPLPRNAVWKITCLDDRICEMNDDGHIFCGFSRFSTDH